MRKLLLEFWKDDAGALIATGWVLVATILVLGSITGLVAVRQAVISELVEFANAVMSLNQSYSFSGQSNCESSTAGSQYIDSTQQILDTGNFVVGGDVGTVQQNPCD